MVSNIRCQDQPGPSLPADGLGFYWRRVLYAAEDLRARGGDEHQQEGHAGAAGNYGAPPVPVGVWYGLNDGETSPKLEDRAGDAFNSDTSPVSSSVVADAY